MSLAAPPTAAGTRPPIGDGAVVYRTQPGTQELPPRYALPAGTDARARLAYWNEVAQLTIALDHTPDIVGNGGDVVLEAIGGPIR